ncbi:hypothetical protein GUITHDRAFT_151909 [Guillardia theta CCMP2712]|uniref:Proteinase inhibitor I42 chagasin domain-containing protein n=1 Tax=Guillardia theta (strain CCMP2712) TaxID=905079 RepID=L1JHL4_GUITC|nr:hypothetical protein GUITHDRAFT_151909 [Guillardia theta CCMP2712]EKX48013.1 hypothetical protein GUITHDRAFT_151909 [Guillardia theta CCMP2712]|mmetsp:Transcript_10464/g.34950  ORF Transcript_10464/g.34950 Transcript_10464/m.34950 type:complete len:131 (-) Transcript_10464:2353-2745(-)|eukprot:XP_005834993.1 hypothetical protein GUITHDRAFT_151909 [Guillardia theta CCMP2712]
MLKDKDSDSLIPDTEKIHTKVGQMFKVELQSSPSTGFTWALDGLTSMDMGNPLQSVRTGASAAIKEVSSKFQASSQNTKLGAPGFQSFVFEATKAGSTIISFSYRRPWEEDSPPSQQVIIEVRAAADKEL